MGDGAPRGRAPGGAVMPIGYEKMERELYCSGPCPSVIDVRSTVAALGKLEPPSGYRVDLGGYRSNHEICLSGPRTTSPNKLKTVLGHPVRRLLLERAE
jgi:hypothetical protein